MQLTTLTSFLLLAATFTSEAGAVENQFSMLGPERDEAQKVSLKGSFPRNSPGVEQISNLPLQTKGSSRVEKINLIPLKVKTDYKSDGGSTWEGKTLDDKNSLRVGHKTLYRTNPLKIDPNWEWESGKLKTLGEAKPVALDESLAGGNPVSWKKYKWQIMKGIGTNNAGWAPSAHEAKGKLKVPTITWDAAVENGKKLWGELQMALRTNPPDKATSLSKLRDEAWIFVNEEVNDELESLQVIFGQMKLAPVPNKFIMRTCMHGVPPVAPGKGRRTTVLTNAFNSRLGIIVAVANFKQEAEETPWSDVVFSQWKDATWHRGDPTNLNYIIRLNIENINTRFIINEAHTKTGFPITDHIKLWTEGDGSDAFFALMGTPNGKGIPRMLKDHQRTLKRKTVAGIHTARTSDGMELMIFALRSVDPPTSPRPIIPRRIRKAAVEIGSTSHISSLEAPPRTIPARTFKVQLNARNDHAALFRRLKQYGLTPPQPYLEEVH